MDETCHVRACKSGPSSLRRQKMHAPLIERTSKFIAFALFSALLVGCGSGNNTSSSSNTNSSTTIQNLSGSDIKYVRASNPETNSSVEQSFNCLQDQYCLLGQQIDPSLQTRLSFFDEKNRLVTAYVFDKEIDKDNVFTVDNRTLGFFLFDALKTKYLWTGVLLDNRLSTFFYYTESPDKLPDEYEELGSYFLQEGSKKASTLDEFLATLNPRLEANEINQINPPANAMLTQSKGMRAQAVGSITCPPEAATFSKFINTIASVIPVQAVKSAVGGVVGVLDKGCGLTVANTIGNVRKDIQELKRKLEDIDKELKGVSFSLSNFRSDDAFKSASNGYDRILTETTSLQTDLNIYNNLLISNNAESLTALYKSSGLTDDMLNTSNTGSIGVLIANLSDTNKSLSWLSSAEVLGTIQNALDVACKSHESIPGDVIAQRMRCNVLATKTINEYTVTYINAAAMVKDLSVLIGNAQSNPNASAKVKAIANPFANSPVWYSADTAVKNTVFNLMSSNLADAISKVSTTFSSGLYDPYNGLTTGLMDKVFEADCRNYQVGKRSTANIKEWYAFPTKPKYIVSGCPTYSGSTEMVSNYYYGATSTRLINVFGVLVEANKLDSNFNPSNGTFVTDFSAEVTGSQCATFNFVDTENRTLTMNQPTKLLAGIPYAIVPSINYSWPWVRPYTGETRTFYIDKPASISNTGQPSGPYESFLCWNPQNNTESWNTFMGTRYLLDKVTYGAVWLSMSQVDDRTVSQYSPKPYFIKRRFACVTGGCSANGNDLKFDSGVVASFQYIKNGSSVSISTPSK